MNRHIWAKTLLSVFGHLDTICGAIDKLVMTHALNSRFVNSRNISTNSTFNVADKILNLTERKKTLINLNIIINSALDCIDIKLSKILVLKHRLALKGEEIAELLKISPRTYFRKQNEAYEKFCKCLDRNGYSEEKLLNMLKDEKWITEIYEQNKKQEEKNEDNLIILTSAHIAYICSTLKKAACCHSYS